MAPTIVIVGSGFSGVATAVHLLEGLVDGARVVMVNRSGLSARGVAYGTSSSHHVLNVPAGRMSAIEDDPDSFVRFLRSRGHQVDGDAFVERRAYGAYLEELLEGAATRRPAVRLERLHGEVVGFEHRGPRRALVLLDGGRHIEADSVVLAIGNYAPLDPSMENSVFCESSARYVRDPWSSGAFDRLDLRQPVLLLGTGLTMVDITLQLWSEGASAGFVALSRRGLLPHSHRYPAHPADPTVSVPDLLNGSVTVRGSVRRIRRATRAGVAAGHDWRDVMASLRPVTARLWHSLSDTERRRFLRHVRPFWEVHRHRVAYAPYEAFSRLRATGQVRVLAGRLQDLREDGTGVCVQWRPRGASEAREFSVGAVVNCMGPASDTRRLPDIFLKALQAQGLAVPDPLGLGLQTSTTGALIRYDGRPSEVLYYVGPFLRARDWEATAVPELRQYARRLAQHIVESFRSGERTRPDTYPAHS